MLKTVFRHLVCLLGLHIVSTCITAAQRLPAAPPEPQRLYTNTLTPIEKPLPLLADHPEFVQPVRETRRFAAPPLVDDEAADLHVRAWRFSYNARGIIEMPNRLRAKHTAVIVVHPWGIDDGQGWTTLQPAGVADFCTVEKNKLAGRHTREVIDPFLQRLRAHVALVMYSLRSRQHDVHKRLYRSIYRNPSRAERAEAQKELAQILSSFKYEGRSLRTAFKLSSETPVRDYFRAFPGLDAGPEFNNAGFWQLPIPVTRDITMHRDDFIYYDADGYDLLKDFLKQHGVRHILLTGYATDMCFCQTTAGYENLSQDFNVFLVGDATLATFPANKTPQYATNAHISFASLSQLITQETWVQYSPRN